MGGFIGSRSGYGARECLTAVYINPFIRVNPLNPLNRVNPLSRLSRLSRVTSQSRIFRTHN
jgi:hypothetical protein